MGASQLAEAVSDLFLYDFSSLPMDVIMEMRDRLVTTLDPMRAELLRFTEDLRKMITAQSQEPLMLATEARNLIATRVEPVIREANHHARQLAERKWQKLYTSAAKALGLAGATFIDPKLFAKAIQQTLEVGALAFADADDRATKATGSAIAQFVLEARNIKLGSKGLTQ